jgi:hypothetical protein
MPLMFDGLGAEAMVDEVFLVFRERLNAAIASQQERYVGQDQRRAAIMGVPYKPLILEPIPVENFHAGSIPSFVTDDDREGNYPMCVVVPGRTVPDGEDASADQYDVFNNLVAIHVFARATMSNEEGFDLVYRRSMRMAEAVHQIVKTDRDLRKMFAGVSGPVLVERSDPWTFPSQDGHGDEWVWQAVMHQYQVKNYSHTPMEV